MPRGLGYIQQTVLETVKEQPGDEVRIKKLAGIVKGKLYPDLWNYDEVYNKAWPRKNRYQFHAGTGYVTWLDGKWTKVSHQEAHKRKLEFTRARVTVHNAIKALIKRGHLLKAGDYISLTI